MRLHLERTRWIPLLMLFAAWLQLTAASVAVVVCCPAAPEEPCCCCALEAACCAEESAAEEPGTQGQQAVADPAAQPCPMSCCWESAPVALPLSAGPVLQPLPLVHGAEGTPTFAATEAASVLLPQQQALHTPLRQHLRCHVLRC